MGLLILLVMIIIPVMEISVFIQASEQIGLWSIIGLIIITAMIGSALLRHQGLSTLLNFNKSLNTGKLPLDEIKTSEAETTSTRCHESEAVEARSAMVGSV